MCVALKSAHRTVHTTNGHTRTQDRVSHMHNRLVLHMNVDMQVTTDDFGDVDEEELYEDDIYDEFEDEGEPCA